MTRGASDNTYVYRRGAQEQSVNAKEKHYRTRTLIQLGGLFEKSGLMKTFDVQAGDNLQENLEKKENIFAILGGLLELKEMIKQDEFHIDLLAQKGAESFKEKSQTTIFRWWSLIEEVRFAA